MVLPEVRTDVGRLPQVSGEAYVNALGQDAFSELLQILHELGSRDKPAWTVQAPGSPACLHRGRVSSIQERKPRRGIAGVTPSDTMTWGSLRIEVRDDEIIVTQPGSNFSAVYYKPRDEPQLIAKGTPSGNYKFLARAWKAANDKARELGWIA